MQFHIIYVINFSMNFDFMITEVNIYLNYCIPGNLFCVKYLLFIIMFKTNQLMSMVTLRTSSNPIAKANINR